MHPLHRTARATQRDTAMTKTRRLAPAWLLGFGNLPLAINGSVGIIAVPDLLAAAHVPEPRIAAVTSLYLAAAFISIPLSPLLDWRFSRKSYAIAATILAAICNFTSLVMIHNLAVLTWVLFASAMAVAMCVNAAGGWFGDIVPTEKKDTLGAWFTVVNFGAGGAVAALIIPLLRDLPSYWGAAVVSGLMLLVLPLFIVTPCPPADRRLASESFSRFARDVGQMFKRKDVQWVLLVFLAPSASFALTNTLSGFGHEFHTSNEMVGLIGGIGVTIAGIVGSLMVPQLTRRISPVMIYLLVGLVGAAFTLSLIVAPRDLVMFGIAMLGQNMFQAAAFSAANVITLRIIGHDNPLAATQFGVLVGATQIPLTYMQMIDGNAFSFGGVSATFLADALISGSVCVVLAFLYFRFGRKVTQV